MEQFDIARVLKYAPKGLKLYSPLLGEVRLEKVSDHDDTIVVTTKYKSERVFFEDGKYDSNGECLLFPSVNHRCWNHWQNTLFLESIGSVCVVDNIMGNKFILDHNGTFFSDGTGSQYSTLIDGDDIGNYLLNSRYATPEETKEFFEELEKRGYKWNGKMVVKKEQNKPKFHEGDWIACEELNTARIIKVDDDRYEVEFIDGSKGFPHIDYIDRNFHLWTIKDAKDGDILACGDKVTDCPFIFHNLTEEQNPRSYCGINTLGNFQDNDENGGFWCHSDEVRPATKEQRDLLFQKMKEEGYEWNPDTKKLVKTTIPIPKFKEGDVIKHTPTGEIAIIKHICSDYYVLDKGTSLYFESQDMWELVASKANLSLEDKVSILMNEINSIKQDIENLKVSRNRAKVRIDSLENWAIENGNPNIFKKIADLEKDVKALTNRLDAIAASLIGITPPLTKDPFLHPDKVTCDDAQCYKGKSVSDAFETPDKAGDCVTLKDMKS